MNALRAYLRSSTGIGRLTAPSELYIVKDMPTAPPSPTAERSSLTDEELVGLLSGMGDTESLGVLYDRHGNRVLNRAWGMVGEKTLAEDLTHDVFLKLFTKAGKYRPDKSFIAWFNVFSYNVIIDELRRRKRMRVVELDEDRWQGPAYDDGAEERQEKELFELRVDRLKAVMALLSETERTMLIMKYQDGISVEDMAGFFGIGISAVKMRLLRTREKVLRLDKETPAHGR